MGKDSVRWPYPRKPALGRALPSNYAEGTRVFDKRVKAKFPIGMSEALLVEDLRRQGFAIRSDPRNVDHKSAAIIRGLIFRTIWSIRWQARAGRIEDVWGVYDVIAP